MRAHIGKEFIIRSRLTISKAAVICAGSVVSIFSLQYRIPVGIQQKRIIPNAVCCTGCHFHIVRVETSYQPKEQLGHIVEKQCRPSGRFICVA